jgi:hypothetical protein
MEYSICLHVKEVGMILFEDNIKSLTPDLIRMSLTILEYLPLEVIRYCTHISRHDRLNGDRASFVIMNI